MGFRRPAPFLTALFIGAFLLDLSVAHGQKPDGTLLVGEDSIPLTLMGMCWRQGQSRECADTRAMFVPPDELEMEAAEVAPGDTLTVAFSLPPTSVTIRPHGLSPFAEAPELDPSSFPAPSEAGIHYFTVSAEWGAGSGLWLMKVRVGGRFHAGVVGGRNSEDIALLPGSGK